LTVAKRFEGLDTETKVTMRRWQYLKGRECLLDGFNSLRSACTAAATSYELGVLINVLFYEQACGIRLSTSARWKGGESKKKELMKGLLLRQVFYTYAQSKFPELKSSIEHFGTWVYFKKNYNMDETGLISQDPDGSPTKNGRHGLDADDDAETPEKPPAAPDGTADCPDRKDDSRYASKSRALALLNKVAKGAYENNFSSLGASTENTTHLRMEAESMSGLREELDSIEELYVKEFKTDDKPDQKAGQIGLGSAGSSLEAPNLVVSTADTIESKEEYDSRLAKYTAECKTAEDQAIEAFLEARIEIVLGSDDVSIVTRRVGNIGWITETALKMFVHDALCARPHDWKKMRSSKKKIKWGGNKVPMVFNTAKEEDSLQLVKALYQNFKSCRSADHLSEDTVVVIVPGPEQDNPDSPAAKAAWESLKRLDGKHVGPKIGTISVNDDDLLSSTNSSKMRWRPPFDDKIVFTYQAGTPPV
jgi:hypothetical protein